MYLFDQGVSEMTNTEVIWATVIVAVIFVVKCWILSKMD